MLTNDREKQQNTCMMERMDLLQMASQNLSSIGEKMRERLVARFGPELHPALSWSVSLADDIAEAHDGRLPGVDFFSSLHRLRRWTKKKEENGFLGREVRPRNPFSSFFLWGRAATRSSAEKPLPGK
ncbi:MAG TPA: hypothetical protein VFV38_44305 [Ktedonobacteraceae bacterium]|nr:hypothetical protein [Ktedonobacteraceae bacterium]